MKILHVTSSYYPALRDGGPIKSVQGLCKALVELGHDVEVVTSNIEGRHTVLDVPLKKVIDVKGVNVIYFPSKIAKRLAWSLPMKKYLQERVREFDIVHLHGVFQCPTSLAARAAFKANIPYIVTPRGMLVNELIQNKNQLIKRLWINLVEQKTIENAAKILVTSAVEYQDVNSMKNIQIPAIHCIPNGVDIPPMRYYKNEFKKPYVLYLGRINWKKGLDRLIKSWQFVNKIHLIIAGNDDEKYGIKVKILVKRYHLQNRIHFIGSVNDEKWSLYQNAKLFVLPSYSENFGNVVLEAMVMKCPVIVTPEVGAAQIVKDYQSGLVVNGEPKNLASTINILLSNKIKRKKMGEKGKQAVINHFSWNAIAKQTEALYFSILNE